MGEATSSAKEKPVLKSALHQTFGLTQSGLESAVTSWLQQFHHPALTPTQGTEPVRAARRPRGAGTARR